MRSPTAIGATELRKDSRSKPYRSRFEQTRSEKRIGADDLRRLRRLSAVAGLMDTAVAIPFTRFRIGADSVLGLVPGIGDAAGALVSIYLINEARLLGIPNEKLARMLGNVGVDVVVGAVPLLGDVFDVYFKSNKRNVDLALDHFGLSRDDVRQTAMPGEQKE